MPDSTNNPAQAGSQSEFSRPDTHSVSIGILTYMRPGGLKTCVASVRRQLERPLPAPWQMSEILIIDNDPAKSARETVATMSETTGPMVRYVSEPTPGIAAARSRALVETSSHILVFIDDDEVAEEGWPHELLELMHETGAAMVGGPVLAEFEVVPPKWIIEGRFFDRDDPAHGDDQDWLRSGNLAIDLCQTRAKGITFDPRFPAGEDSAYTRWAKAEGLKLVWSSKGAITETVGPRRFEVDWRLRREYLSHRCWTRATLDLADGSSGRFTARLRVLAVAGARVATGAGQLVKAVPTRSKANAVHGLIDLVGVAGKLVELVSYRRP